MPTTDYDGPIHRDYARGRALKAEQYAAWADAFGQHLPGRRPLDGLDLGSGTGRFSPMLADSFGPVVGVEPSTGMRETAERSSAHEDVRYLPGSAEEIPLEDAAVDYCLLFLAWHHVTGRSQGAAEIARVLRPGGVLLCRAQFSDLMPDLWWLRHFPHGAEVDAAMYRPLSEEIETFSAAGLVPWPGLVRVEMPSAETKGEVFERLRLRTLSTLVRMPDADFRAGIAALEAEVERDRDVPVPRESITMLVMSKPDEAAY
ncbi:Methyltransferase domain-containing protein [Nocardioides sp. YR527]|uniref:class I SAM-dependent methyltransferase n=1 Tax=Nocardioides sp. YR527 TaxID=1881028 RepID=UPI00088D0448|nr:class I SAM-dependent methyltransferase [Nocardioides sp. YR527]SDL21026.1 Methyltransferase domain-containing protein [Nocardioides sp. YR527]